jgi:hypothetical protein
MIATPASLLSLAGEIAQFVRSRTDNQIEARAALEIADVILSVHPLPLVEQYRSALRGAECASPDGERVPQDAPLAEANLAAQPISTVRLASKLAARFSSSRVLSFLSRSPTRAPCMSESHLPLPNGMIRSFLRGKGL